MLPQTTQTIAPSENTFPGQQQSARLQVSELRSAKDADVALDLLAFPTGGPCHRSIDQFLFSFGVLGSSSYASLSLSLLDSIAGGLPKARLVPMTLGNIKLVFPTRSFTAARHLVQCGIPFRFGRPLSFVDEESFETG